MELRVYNTLSSKKELFKPLKEGQVNLYVCGMTVYDNCHLGHARAYTAFDIVYRVLKQVGYKVKYVRNITDIDDKIIARAKESDPEYNQNPIESCTKLTQKFTGAFQDDMTSLGLLKPTLEPKATEHISEMIVMIQDLIEKGHAYESNGSVYFDIHSFPDYGCLSKRNLDDMGTHSRLGEDTDKRNPLDFALWKKHAEDEPFFESPFGPGRPGWHIECSAMSCKYLSETFDIHGGGQDLIFPHHENEICQSRAATGGEFAKYWLHNGFITIKQEKMSKSLKNFKTLKELLAFYPPMVLKFYLLSTHYRSPLEFNDQLIQNCQEGLKRIQNTLTTLKNKLTNTTELKNNTIPESFLETLLDDFNTPKAIGFLFEFIQKINKALMDDSVEVDTLEKYYQDLTSMLSLLGIEAKAFQVNRIENTGDLNSVDKNIIQSILDSANTDLSDKDITNLVVARLQAKKDKDYSLADSIRDFLTSSKIELRDSRSFSEWQRTQ